MATSAVNGSPLDPAPTAASLAKGSAPQHQQHQQHHHAHYHQQQQHQHPSQARASLATRMSDSARKTDDDNSSPRRTAQPKAWTGVNPITQRSNVSSQPNGTTQRSGSRRVSYDISPEKVALERLLWALNNSVGLECDITTKSGERFTGIFAGAQKHGDEYKLLFKMAKAGHKTTDDYLEPRGYGSEHSLVFSASSLLTLNVPEVQASSKSSASAANGTAAGFRTDSDIAGNMAARERNLQRWKAPTEQVGDMSLGSHGDGDWDQFKTNKEKFGIVSTYAEDYYTTKIDKQHPLYDMREREAAKLAKEMESSAAHNAHIREERGLDVDDDGADEEDKYSGVRRPAQDVAPLQSNQPNRYMPPARRAQVANNPPAPTDGQVDPAIISSQRARPAPTEPEATGKRVEQHKSTMAQAPVSATVSAPAPAPAATGVPEPPKTERKAPEKPQLVTKELKPLRQHGRSGATATENVEADLLDSFRQFAANEKIKVQDSKRTRSAADKAVKLNDLMKFSKNFKLLTPVPKDLIPILAKDESKQREIVQKAQRNADSTKAAKVVTSLTDQKSQRPLAAARWEVDPPTGPNDAPVPSSRSRHHDVPTHSVHVAKDRHQQSREGGSSRAQNGLSARLADSHRMHKQGGPINLPNPIPIQDARASNSKGGNFASTVSSPQKPPSMRGPPSATSAKFNANASEFRPNPTASAFKPVSLTATGSSPGSGSVTRAISPSAAAPKFFGDKKSFGKWSERPDPLSVVAPKMPEVDADKKEGDDPAAAKGSKTSSLPAANGYFQYPYKTHPTWNRQPADGETLKEVHYWEAFEKQRHERRPTPSHSSPVNPTAHQHQLPFHLQNGASAIPHVQPPPQMPHQMHPQPHHFAHGGPHYDDHHMRPSASSSGAYPAPSPRLQSSNMAGYPSPMAAHAQLAAYGQPVQYVVPQNAMGARQFSNGPPTMIPAGAPGHLAPMMVQQPSSGGGGGGYMPQPMAIPYAAAAAAAAAGGPQMAVYQASPAGPAPMYASPSQPHHPTSGGYPSPGRSAPMMVHQGSHQGHQQPVYIPVGQFAQPIYAQQPPNHGSMRGGFHSPQPHFGPNAYPQQHQYPQQPHRTPSSGYAQPHQVHHQHVPSQPGPPPPVGNPNDMGEDNK